MARLVKVDTAASSAVMPAVVPEQGALARSSAGNMAAGLIFSVVWSIAGVLWSWPPLVALRAWARHLKALQGAP